MSISQALFLGALQGLTEFLPVSSSGHLVIFQHYLGLRQPLVFFDVLLHLGTLGAVIVYFRRDLYKIIASFIYFKKKNYSSLEYRNLFYLIIAGTIPTAVVGIILQKWKNILFSGVLLPSGMLILTGILLLAGERIGKSRKIVNISKGKGKEKRKLNLVDALCIGFMQGVAIIPGISRSGATISTALMRGVKRDIAFHYSFLLSIPVIIGATGLELKQAVAQQNFPPNPFPWIVGTLLAFGVGLISLKIFYGVFKRKKLFLFSCYCWAVGGGILSWELIKLLRG